MKTPIITSVTPSFNQGRFIDETINTVLSQKGNFYIDYIIMDGGSTDNSVEIIKKYETLLAENCRIQEKDHLQWYVKKEEEFPWNNCHGIGYRWKSEKDHGQVEALKKGFGMAKGDIYCWLNSDDLYVNPEVLQTVCTYFDRDPDLELITGDGPFISATGTELKIHHVDRIDPRELIYLDYHILQPATFFRKEIYRETDLDEHYTCAFDADFFTGLVLAGVKYKKVNHALAAYRLHKESKTLKLSKIRCAEQIEITREYSKRSLSRRWYLPISILYRKTRRLYEDRYKDKIPIVWAWKVFRRICYKLITGRWKR